MRVSKRGLRYINFLRIAAEFYLHPQLVQNNLSDDFAVFRLFLAAQCGDCIGEPHQCLFPTLGQCSLFPCVGAAPSLR